MSITENTTIKELLYNKFISSDTYNILAIAKLETIQMILEYTDYGQKIFKLFHIEGILYENYQELRILLKIYNFKQKNVQTEKEENWSTYRLDPNMTVTEMSEKSLISTEVLQLFIKVGVYTLQEAINLDSESNSYKMNYKIKLGIDNYTKLISNIKDIKEKYDEYNSSISNSCTNKKTNSIKVKNHTQNLQEGTNKKTNSIKVKNHTQNLQKGITFANLFEANLISRGELILLQNAKLKYLKDFQQLTLSSKHFLKNNLGFENYWKIMDLAGKNNPLSTVDNVINTKDNKFNIKDTNTKTLEGEEANSRKKEDRNLIYTPQLEDANANKFNSIFLTTTIEELYDKKIISYETSQNLHSIKIRTYGDLLAFSNKGKDFRELSLCANFSKTSISEIKELDKYYYGLKNVNCEKTVFGENINKSTEKQIEKNDELHKSKGDEE